MYECNEYTNTHTMERKICVKIRFCVKNIEKPETETHSVKIYPICFTILLPHSTLEARHSLTHIIHDLARFFSRQKKSYFRMIAFSGGCEK
jgi:hypothetical protein